MCVGTLACAGVGVYVRRCLWFERGWLANEKAFSGRNLRTFEGDVKEA